MKVIDAIPIGKQFKETRDILMQKTNILDIRTFRKEITKLRKQYTIIFDDGYYLPASKEEYLEFIKGQNMKVHEISKTIELAYKEMEEKENV